MSLSPLNWFDSVLMDTLGWVYGICMASIYVRVGSAVVLFSLDTPYSDCFLLSSPMSLTRWITLL